MSSATLNTFFIIGAVGALALALHLYLLSEPPSAQFAHVEIAGETFRLEIAATREKRFRGLSGRESLPVNAGMLFVYPQPQALNFCMRQCLIDIDLLYLDPDGAIVSMAEMKRDLVGELPKTYSSTAPAMYALELRAGTIQRLNLKQGMSVLLRNVPPPHTAEYD
ncbi:MAG: DUF192 domain-containing protein [Phycisphaerales bacterium]|jgi:uncharacterized protein|nr:DUF192 domain-containing protein [Phycisphaerales bacterium]MBT7171996.1 DUF192 domain-containing protein [Phycisphaerales bacterium]